MAGERALTRRLERFFGSSPQVAVGIGDDAAVLRHRGDRAVVCCDPVVAGVHFDPGTPWGLVGRKAVNRNLSDLAAMGAHADWLLLSLVLPRRHPPAALAALLVGVRRAARRAGVTVVGGDVASHRGGLVVTVTAGGHLRPGERALTRHGVRIGDTLHVSGPLGGSRLGRHLRFAPALAAGRWLAAQPEVHAAMDVSDGLALDLATMLRCAGPRVGAELAAAAIPITAAARRLAGGDPRRALQRALGDGEDHVLLWAQAEGRPLPSGGPLSLRSRRPIGRVVAAPGLWMWHDGQRSPLPLVGYEHDVSMGRGGASRPAAGAGP